MCVRAYLNENDNCVKCVLSTIILFVLCSRTEYIIMDMYVCMYTMYVRMYVCKSPLVNTVTHPVPFLLHTFYRC